MPLKGRSFILIRGCRDNFREESIEMRDKSSRTVQESTFFFIACVEWGGEGNVNRQKLNSTKNV